MDEGPTYQISFSVLPADGDGGDFQVCVHVNGVELTSTAAGHGMDPRDLLIGGAGLGATSEPRTVPIARCTCGIYGCGSTDITITRDGDFVHWDWTKEIPQARALGADFAHRPRTTFDAVQYDVEAARVAQDHAWETSGVTAYRLLVTGLERKARVGREGVARPSERRLPIGNDLTLFSADTDYRDPSLFSVSLMYRDTHQVFLQFPWLTQTPGEMAERVRKLLDAPPTTWTASWHPLRTNDRDRPPPIAGPGWSRYVHPRRQSP